MEKIVVLNSGGFDSITLLGFLHDIEEVKEEIHSLHFLYGARNESQQEKCVDKACEKYGAVNMKVKLPPFSWTSSKFFNSGYDYNTQYLEYRNLIFLSYALSYAQSIGASKIYLATLKSGGYPDTSELFFKGLNSFSQPLTGIEILTPFADIECKEELLQYAILTGMTPGDYFSCDTPKESGERCGECLDCQALNWIDNELEINHPFKALYQSGFDYEDKTFIEQLRKIPKNREVRALINNECQLKCSHCFYGFDKMASEKVDKETYYNALKELVLEHGFTNIHFSGKEPLIGDDLEYYAERIKQDNLPCTFNVVTNGILIPQKIKRLEELGIEKIFLSVDDVFNTNGVRTVSNVTRKALNACNEVGVPVEVFIDLHYNNYLKVGNIVKYLAKEYGVKDFFVRTIRSIGNAVDQDKLTGDKLYEVFLQLENVTKNGDVNVMFSISSEYVTEVLEHDRFTEIISVLDSMYTLNYSSTFRVFLERYCERYSDITLTPDGYVLGCASEVSRSDYDKFATGNITETPLPDILNKGVELRCSCASWFPKKCCSCMVNKF